jgi:ribonuclease HII
LPSFDLEEGLRDRGYDVIAGLDEVGRGPLAGPVVAAAVVFPIREILDAADSPSWLEGIDDSKVLTPPQRLEAVERIRAHSTAIGLGMASSREIDAHGISGATAWAMRRAVKDLPIRPSFILVDFVRVLDCGIPFHAEVRGDSASYSIAAASIVAKVNRDLIMERADALYPGYGFASHKGYATARHLQELAHRGPCPIHRRSFSPMRRPDPTHSKPAKCRPRRKALDGQAPLDLGVVQR